MKQIAPGLFTFTGLIAGRVYMIEDDDGLTLIDASIPPAAKKIIKQLAAAGHSISNLKRILITHAHPDHVGALPMLSRASGAEVLISDIEQPTLEGKQSIPRVPAAALTGVARLLRPPEVTLKDMKADRTLKDGDMLTEVMGGLHVIATPGHAPGHLAFWQPERRILFCGDTIFRMPTPRLRLPFSFLTVDMAENIRSIKRLIQLEPALVCFGHGRPLQENAAQRLWDFYQGVEARQG
jgi:glyoxylase-like metal-dependent hydrolase (beta-lactamase superfamily II)